MLHEKDAIAHYASPYYDPQKAHEYYMKNRELKGRSSSGTVSDNSRSTSKLNDSGKAIWKQVQGNIKAEKKSVKENLNAQRDAQIEAMKNKSQQSQEKIFEKLEKLQNATFKKKGAFDKAVKKSFSKAKVSRELRASIQAVREAYAQYKKSTDASYESIYQTEYDKILAEYAKKGGKSL